MATRKRALIFVLERVAITDTCWHWTGHVDKYGYGKVSVGNIKGVPAHRVAYALWKGPLRKGCEVHHKDVCGSRDCINPEHLGQLPKTKHKQLHANMIDGVRVCRRCGEPIVGDNAQPNGPGYSLRCRRCNRERNRG